MKRRAKAGNTAGYTILEVMIVLAVTGALFVSTALLLRGRQAQNEANVSVRTFESKLQTVASEVANGYYQNGFNCQPTGNSVIVSPGNAGPGTNLGCVFLGKIVSLKLANAEVITVVGRQYLSNPPNSTTDVSDLNEAKPIVVAKQNIDITENYDYLYGLQITKAVSIADPTKTYKALAFMVQLGGGASTGSVSNGSRRVLLYGLDGSAASNNTAAKDIDPASASFYAVPDGIRLCFLSGNGEKGEIEIGGTGNQSTTTVLMNKGVGSEC